MKPAPTDRLKVTERERDERMLSITHAVATAVGFGIPMIIAWVIVGSGVALIAWLVGAP